MKRGSLYLAVRSEIGIMQSFQAAGRAIAPQNHAPFMRHFCRVGEVLLSLPGLFVWVRAAPLIFGGVFLCWVLVNHPALPVAV